MTKEQEDELVKFLKENITIHLSAETFHGSYDEEGSGVSLTASIYVANTLIDQSTEWIYTK